MPRLRGSIRVAQNRKTWSSVERPDGLGFVGQGEELGFLPRVGC